MCMQSTQSVGELASIAINSTKGGNMDLLGRALRNLQEKPPSEELFRAICSIMITFEAEGINGSFVETATKIFNTCSQGGGK